MRKGLAIVLVGFLVPRGVRLAHCLDRFASDGRGRVSPRCGSFQPSNELRSNVAQVVVGRVVGVQREIERPERECPMRVDELHRGLVASRRPLADEAVQHPFDEVLYVSAIAVRRWVEVTPLSRDRG